MIFKIVEPNRATICSFIGSFCRFIMSVTAVAHLGVGLLLMGAITLLFLSHLFLDSRIFVAWWVKQIMRTEGQEAKWLSIMVDQIFHVIF